MHGKLNVSLKFAQLTALLVSLTCTIVAQQQSAAIQPSFNPAAYRVGERLTYNVAFSHFVSAAHVEMLIAARGNFFGRDSLQLRAHVETTGVVNAALLSINNDYTTYVYPQTGLPFRAQRVVREAGRTSEASIDYNQPAGTDAIPPKLGMGEFPGTYDLLSAFYRMRAMPLVEGWSYSFTARNEGEQYQAEVKVTDRQMIKTNVGSFNTLVARVNVKNGHDYNIRVYFSDDERHVPVLITAKHPSGEIRIELVGSELAAPTSPNPNQQAQVTPSTTPLPRNSFPINSTTGNANGSSGSSITDSPIATLDLPFKVGEQLNYQVYLGGGPQSVGSLTLAVRARGRYFNRDGLLFAATAQTTGAGARVFAVRDLINSYVDPPTLLPFRTELSLSEGKYRTNRNYNLDQNRGAATGDNNRDRIDIPVGTHDLLSAIYAIRTFDLTPLKKNAISIMATNRPRTLFVNSKGRETIEIKGQKISALRLELTTDDPQSDKMQLRIWVGDDARHLPLRITAMTELGPVRADLAIVPAN